MAASREERFCALRTLSEQEYASAIRSVSEIVVGGAVYDALIAACAAKAQADVLLTSNTVTSPGFGQTSRGSCELGRS